MSKALLKLAKEKDPYLQKTAVENLFIYEFLPTAPGEYVKVYLFGLMYAQSGMEIDIAKLSRVMRISEEDILLAWGYWAKKGLIKILHNNDNTEYEIEYASLMQNLYGKTPKDNETKNVSLMQTAQSEDSKDEDPISKVVNQEIKAIFSKYESLTGRMLSAQDARKIGETIKTYSILPDIMSYSVEYNVSEDRMSVNQIIKTAINWAKEGCKNLADVKEYIDRNSKRKNYYSLVFREVGFTRLPNPPDMEMMDKWFDEMGFSIKEVLAACQQAAGLREPSLKYVNKVLENKKLEQGGINTKKKTQTEEKKSEAKAPVSKKVLKEYYEYIRLESEKEQREKLAKVYSEICEIQELDELEKNINTEMLALGIRGDKEKKKALREQRKQIIIEKGNLLKQNGYPENYLDRKYKCAVCKDTGITDEGKVCSCTEARAREALEWNKKRI